MRRTIPTPQSIVSEPANDYERRDVDAVYQRLLKLEDLVKRLESRLARLERERLEQDE